MDHLTENKPQRHLLLVDDEESILQSLRRLLRRDGYQIHLATSGADGLAILEQHPIGVILSDQRMPVMTGSEFLSQVKARRPDTIRIILSGYTELNSITDAINQGAIYKFLTKPWDDEQLRAHLVEAFERFDMKAENSRLATLSQAVIDALPDGLLVIDAISGRVRTNQSLATQWQVPAEVSARDDILRWIAGQSASPETTEAALLAATRQPEEPASGNFERTGTGSIAWYANPMRVGPSVVGQVLGFTAASPK